ncbi:MAG TPA: S-methyl-5'-thioadenosine phosphorylase [Elusimicrobia bacterium]|nr:S-methyl-5'-thioadenosine phosphorylase [Elusimicrobiota bacterium]
MKNIKIAIIGGSGVYEIEGIKILKELKIKTPFGLPSDKIRIGEFDGVKIAFLPRHAVGHKIMPTEVNSRANIFALKKIGVEKIISISACGSLKEEIKPRDFVIPDQLFDRTKSRPSTFFGEGIVAHVGFAEPYCPQLRKILIDTAKSLALPVHAGGTYICIEGPQFSTKAESKVYRSLGFSVIGMTNLPEAKLAREAGICFATVSLATDYDVWKEGEEVSAETVMANMKVLTENVKKLVKSVIVKLQDERNCSCKDALKYAIMTSPKAMNPITKKKISLLIKKYI